MALNSATRLLVMTVIGLTIAFIFRPQGLGVVFGMALFQVLLVVSTALPVMKKLKAGPADGLEGEAANSNDREDPAAEAGIQVGHHTEAHWFGLTVNTDTVLATAIAAVIVHRAGILLARQGHIDRCPQWRAAVLGSDHGAAAQPGRDGDRHEDRAVRAAARGHALRLHPGSQLAVGAAGAVHRLRRAPSTSCSSRPRRTSTSCWRSRCSCSSATTRRASGAAASSDTR